MLSFFVVKVCLVLKPNILDVEASGFGDESYPIEVGYCLASGEKFCVLIKPLKEWCYWDERAEALHGISRTSLNEAGQSVRQVAATLNEKLEGLTLYSDAWAFDKRWLNLIHAASNIPAAYEVRAIEHIQTECQHHCWDAVRHQVMKAHSGERHRASTDAELIQSVFAQSLQQCSNKE